MIAESEIAQARTRFDLIAADIPLKRVGRELAGLCPFHGEKTPSFYVVPDKGMFHCFGCGAHGDAIGYVMRRRHLDFLEAVAEINGTAHRTPQKITGNITRVPEERPDDVAAARAIWAEASATHRPRVELYFSSRFLPVRKGIPPTIREHPGLYCSERHRLIPALVAAFKDSAGYVSAVQRIWLEDSYADINNPRGSRVEGASKKTRGEMRDGCVRLAPPGPYLGLAEGIETGAAASDLFRMPVWATCGLSRLGFPGHWHLARPGERPLLWVPPDRPPEGSGAHWIEARPPSIWVPPGTKRVTIFGDNGDVGHWVAEFAAEWWRRHDQDAVAVFPRDDYSDYADQLRAKALQTRGEVW